MKQHAGDRRFSRTGIVGWLAFAIVLALVPFSAVAQSQQAGPEKKFEIKTPWGGVTASGQAKPQDVGLPLYPGARPLKERPSEDPQVTFSFWTEKEGFKLVVLKYESDERMEKVADFYRKALAKYGKVLECTGSGKRVAAKDERSNELDCEESEPSPGGLELKAGKKDMQRILALTPKAKGCEFAMVYLETRKTPREPQ